MSRWDHYILFRDNEISNFLDRCFNTSDSKNILFVMGSGFDVRMNSVLTRLLSSVTNSNIHCLLIEYHEGDETPSEKYRANIDDNRRAYQDLVDTHANCSSESLSINIWKLDKGGKRRIGDRDANSKIYSYNIDQYSDIVVDVSSLPRGIYFPLIGTLLKKMDATPELKSKNLFVAVTENHEIDSRINEEGIEERIRCIHGFGGGIEQEANQRPKVFFPVLGGKKSSELSRIYSHLNPQEICPILPFPSKNLRRSDNLIADYHKFLFEEVLVESHNIMYAPEQNPFEMYRILSQAITNYNESLDALGKCNVAVTAFTSKLLTLGVLLAAYEIGQGVGVYNLEAQGYSIIDDDINKLKELNSNSEIFLMWLNGEAYE